MFQLQQVEEYWQASEDPPRDQIIPRSEGTGEDSLIHQADCTVLVISEQQKEKGTFNVAVLFKSHYGQACANQHIGSSTHEDTVTVSWIPCSWWRSLWDTASRTCCWRCMCSRDTSSKEASLWRSMSRPCTELQHIVQTRAYSAVFSHVRLSNVISPTLLPPPPPPPHINWMCCLWLQRKGV